jgi:hypothetical protein
LLKIKIKNKNGFVVWIILSGKFVWFFQISSEGLINKITCKIDEGGKKCSLEAGEWSLQ